MDVHNLRFLAPNPSGVLEVTDELLFLGVHADTRLPTPLMGRAFRADVLKLLIPLWLLGTFQLFPVAFQAVPVPFQQPADYWQTHAVLLINQALTDVSQATIEPLPRAHRIAPGVRFHNR
jgi:hypothetical protein